VLPVLAGYNLHPTLDVKANGTIDRLAMDLDVRSEAGSVRHDDGGFEDAEHRVRQ
jgi:hypothetical protein